MEGSSVTINTKNDILALGEKITYIRMKILKTLFIYIRKELKPQSLICTSVIRNVGFNSSNSIRDAS